MRSELEYSTLESGLRVKGSRWQFRKARKKTSAFGAPGTAFRRRRRADTITHQLPETDGPVALMTGAVGLTNSTRPLRSATFATCEKEGERSHCAPRRHHPAQMPSSKATWRSMPTE
jgi:hypothetical protein